MKKLEKKNKSWNSVIKGQNNIISTTEIGQPHPTKRTPFCRVDGVLLTRCHLALSIPWWEGLDGSSKKDRHTVMECCATLLDNVTRGRCHVTSWATRGRVV